MGDVSGIYPVVFRVFVFNRKSMADHTLAASYETPCAAFKIVLTLSGEI